MGGMGYLISTPMDEWSVLGSAKTIFWGSAMGAFGATIIGGAWFGLQGLYQGVQVWRDPDASAFQKALASVDVIVGIGTAWALKGQIHGKVLEWKSLIKSGIPLTAEVQTSLGAIRQAFNAGEKSITVGKVKFLFVRDAPPGYLGGANIAFPNEIVLTGEMMTGSNKELMKTIIHENLHRYRYKHGFGGEGFGPGMVAEEEGLIRQLTDQIYDIGIEWKWW